MNLVRMKNKKKKPPTKKKKKKKATTAELKAEQDKIVKLRTYDLSLYIGKLKLKILLFNI